MSRDWGGGGGSTAQLVLALLRLGWKACLRPPCFMCFLSLHAPRPLPLPPALADLAEVAPEIGGQLAPAGASRTLAQAVVDAVVALLETGAFSEAAAGAAGPGASSGDGQDGQAAETAALQLLAAHLAAGRAVVSGGVLLRVLRHLAAAPGADMSREEREAVFCDVVAAAGIGMSAADRQQVRRRARGLRRNVAAATLLHMPACGCAACAPCLLRPLSLLTLLLWPGGAFRRPSSSRGRRTSCWQRRGCGMPRATLLRRSSAWRAMPGEAPGPRRACCVLWHAGTSLVTGCSARLPARCPHARAPHPPPPPSRPPLPALPPLCLLPVLQAPGGGLQVCA